MKKILNEWKKFLKESEEEDDKEVAAQLLAAIDPMSKSTKQSTDFLRLNKKRVIRVLRNFFDSVGPSVFSVAPSQDVVRVGKKQHYFPAKDFLERLSIALEILEDPRSEFNFSQFNRETQSPNSPYQGKYGPKDHAGGATDTGFVVPFSGKDEQIEQIVKLINNYKSYYQGKGEDYVIASVDYDKSLQSLLGAYELLLGMWISAGAKPDHSEVIKLVGAKESAERALSAGIELTPAEQAELHMKNAQKMLDAGLRESSVEFLAAKKIYKKLGEKDRERIANEMFRKARRLR